jgi:hypothetical protein
MCFNLFGELWADLALADKAVHTWWPDDPHVDEPHGCAGNHLQQAHDTNGDKNN